jgi:hypothetical protein
MTETNGHAATDAALDPLPTVVKVTEAEMQTIGMRIPSAEMLDRLERVGAPPMEELMATNQNKLRYLAFRVLLRDWPLRDATSLWMHAYFCEIEVTATDPTGPVNATGSPLSAATTAASPATSTG